MPRRDIAAVVLAAAAIVVLVCATIWSWNTADYWETIPVVPCLAATGILAGLAYYAWRSRFSTAFAVAVGVSTTTFWVTLFAQLRWTS